MARENPSRQELMSEVADLRRRLEEAEETLRAIRNGEVDALVVSSPEGQQVYTLKGADHSYRVLVETINEGTATLALDGDILYANQQLAEILGTPLERLIGTRICQYVKAEDRELFTALLEQGRLEASKGEVAFRSRHGMFVPAYLSFKSLNLPEAPGAVCLVVTDLTGQKRQEAILAEEQLSRTIFEQAEAVILVVDPQGRIIRASHEAHQLYRGNLLLQQFDEVLPLASLDTSAKEIGPAAYRPFSVNPILQGRIYHGLEVSFHPHEGQVRLDLLLNAGPLRGSQGEVLGAVVALTDITDRKKAETEREALLVNIKDQAEEMALQAEKLREQNEELDSLMQGLRESEERYRRLVEMSPETVAVHQDGKYVFINQAGARLFGAQSPREIIGKPVLDLVHPGFRNPVAGRMKRAQTGGITPLKEIKILRLDGQAVDVEATGRGIEFQGQAAVQVVLRDITERKRAEEAFQESRKQALAQFSEIESIYQSAPVGLAVFDRQLRYTRINQKLAEINGVPLEEHLGRTPREVIPDLADQAEELLEHILETGEPVLDMEITGTTQAQPGIWRTWIEQWVPLKDAAGEVVGVSVVAEEITERKQAEEALRQAHDELEQRVRERTAELHQTVETLQAEIGERERAQALLANERQRFYSVLERIPAYVALISPEGKIPFANREFIRRFGDPGDRHCYESLFGLQQPCEGCKSLEVFKTGTPAIWEWSGPDGNTYQIYDYPFTDVDGSPLVLEMGMDITTLKQAEQAIKKSEEDLRFLSSQLLSAQEQERKRVAYELHDDVGQALTVMKMQLRIAEKHLSADNKAREEFELVRTHLNYIVETVRRLSRALSPSVLEDLGLVKGLKHLFKETCNRYDIKCFFHLDNVDGLFSPEAQINIYRIFQEILNNVLKHSQADRIDLHISRMENSVNFSLSDNGAGFDVEEVLTTRTKDRGLGLTSMEERTRMMGGSFTIESKPGTGTTININVPLSGGGEINY